MEKLVIKIILIFYTTNVFCQWETDRKLSEAEGSAHTNENMGPCLISSGDTIHVVWYDTQKNFNAIYYKRSTDKGITWTNDIRLSETPAYSDFPSIAKSGNYLHVVFRDKRGPKYTSYYIRSTDNGLTWGPEVFLDTTCFWPSVTAAGNRVFVGENDTIVTGNTEIFLRRSIDNGGLHGFPNKEFQMATIALRTRQ